MYQNINKIYHAAIYVRLSKEDGDISSSAKLESNSISNQRRKRTRSRPVRGV